jgi:hypothetical protein
MGVMEPLHEKTRPVVSPTERQFQDVALRFLLTGDGLGVVVETSNVVSPGGRGSVPMNCAKTTLFMIHNDLQLPAPGQRSRLLVCISNILKGGCKQASTGTDERGGSPIRLPGWQGRGDRLQFCQRDASLGSVS